MDRIADGLKAKGDEIQALKTEIDALNRDSKALKSAVKEFESKRQKINEMKKRMKILQKNYQTVVSFFKNYDEHYLDNVFPLFEGHQDGNQRDWFGQDEAGVRSNTAEVDSAGK